MNKVRRHRRESRFMQKAILGHIKAHSGRRVGKLAYMSTAVLLGLSLAGCSTSGSSQDNVTTATGEKRVTQKELEAYCPRVSLREATSFFNRYEKGGDGDSERVIYQAAISDVTRDCRRANGTLTIDLAAAGRVVPGPKSRGGAVSLSIRVTVMQGDKELSSTVHKQSVNLNNNQTATQFVFSGNSVSVPEASDRSVQIFIGFAEGA